MTGKIQTKQKVINKKFQKRHKTHGSFKRNVSITQAEKLINCKHRPYACPLRGSPCYGSLRQYSLLSLNTRAVCMPPAGVSMLRFLVTGCALSLNFAYCIKSRNMPSGDKHVNDPCGRLRSVTKLRILHKRSNMPSGDKHVSVPCGRLRAVTKISHIVQKV